MLAVDPRSAEHRAEGPAVQSGTDEEQRHLVASHQNDQTALELDVEFPVDFFFLNTPVTHTLYEVCGQL